MSRTQEEKRPKGRRDESAGDLPEEKPAPSPTKLPKRAWLRVLRGAGREFSQDSLTDSAAALTYYAVLALFPAVLALISIVGFLGPDTTTKLLNNLGTIVPGSIQSTLKQIITSLQGGGQQKAGVAFIIGLALSIWSASGYIAAFMRAANVVYDVPEGRPAWKTIPTRLATTVVLLILMVAVAVIVVFTGPVAQQAGNLLGLGSAAVTAWGIVKWPVLLLILMVMVAILYWAAPNAKQGLRWISPGSVLGVGVWLIASGLFAVYLANFANYQKTYGTFAGVIIFFVWIWISNLAILLGAEFNAELDRARAEADGLPRGAEPYVELRDTRKLDADEKAEVEGSRLHLNPARGGDSGSIGRSPADDNHRSNAFARWRRPR
jgi:membrane protein